MKSILSEKDIPAVDAILIKQLDVAPAQITLEAKIREDLRADSLDVVEIGMALEEQFNLSFPDDEMEKISTVGDLYEALAIFLERMEARK